jgi:hypothetical protein
MQKLAMPEILENADAHPTSRRAIAICPFPGSDT